MEKSFNYASEVTDFVRFCETIDRRARAIGFGTYATISSDPKDGGWAVFSLYIYEGAAFGEHDDSFLFSYIHSSNSDNHFERDKENTQRRALDKMSELERGFLDATEDTAPCLLPALYRAVTNPVNA